MTDILERIRNALDSDDEHADVDLYGPQFERTDGIDPDSPPTTTAGVEELESKPKGELEELGLRKWDDDGLWLLPHEWHDDLPQDHEFTSILGETVTLEDDYPETPDKRFGCLSCGITPGFEHD